MGCEPELISTVGDKFGGVRNVGIVLVRDVRAMYYQADGIKLAPTGSTVVD